jgi:hypothetical protein
MSSGHGSLLSDKNNGKLYIGSAYGEEGIWQRWQEYSKTLHGGNKRLKELYKREGESAFQNFQYTILETLDRESSADEVIAIENRWKAHLLTREYGYNDN